MDKIRINYYTEVSEEYEKYKYLVMLDMTKEKLERLNEDKTFVSAISYEEDQKLTLNTEKQIFYEEGVQTNKCDIVKEMHRQNFSLKQISSIVKLPIEEIKNILGEN